MFQSLIGILADFNWMKFHANMYPYLFQSLIGILADFNDIYKELIELKGDVSIPHRDFSRFQR